MERLKTLNIILCLFLAYLSLLQAYTTVQSHIQTKTPTLDFSNAGYLSKIGFPFKLSTQLLTTEYLKITFPFTLHSNVLSVHPKY